MTNIKAPVVFNEADFFQDSGSGKRMICLTAECAAEKANEILSQRLKSLYFHERDNYLDRKIVGSNREENDTHIIWGFDPIEIPKPPVKKEITREELERAYKNVFGLTGTVAFLELSKELGL